MLVQDWYFRSRKNRERHRDLVRAYFTPQEHHLDGARAAVEPARAGGGLLVGVHIRRTDYDRFKGGSFFDSHGQYRSVMEGVEAAFPGQDATFFVCSDAPVPRDVFAGLNVFRGNGHQVEDLYALALCDRLVGPPSTYSAWASWYGDVPRYQILDPDEVATASSFEVDPGLSRWPSATTTWEKRASG